MANDDRVLGKYHRNELTGDLFYKHEKISGDGMHLKQLDDGHATTQGHAFYHGGEIEGLSAHEAQTFKTFGAGYSGAGNKMLYMGKVSDADSWLWSCPCPCPAVPQH